MAYKVEFTGKLTAGSQIDQVKLCLSKKLGISEQQAASLFEKAPLVVKQYDSEEAAKKLAALLATCGCVTTVTDMSVRKAAPGLAVGMPPAVMRFLAWLNVDQVFEKGFKFGKYISLVFLTLSVLVLTVAAMVYLLSGPGDLEPPEFDDLQSKREMEEERQRRQQAAERLSKALAPADTVKTLVAVMCGKNMFDGMADKQREKSNKVLASAVTLKQADRYTASVIPRITENHGVEIRVALRNLEPEVEDGAEALVSGQCVDGDMRWEVSGIPDEYDVKQGGDMGGASTVSGRYASDIQRLVLLYDLDPGAFNVILGWIEATDVVLQDDFLNGLEDFLKDAEEWGEENGEDVDNASLANEYNRTFVARQATYRAEQVAASAGKFTSLTVMVIASVFFLVFLLVPVLLRIEENTRRVQEA